MENKKKDNYKDLYFEMVQRINKYGVDFEDKVMFLEKAVKRIGKFNSDFKVSFLSPHYNVDNEGKKVTCHLPFKVNTGIFEEHMPQMMKEMFNVKINVSVGCSECHEGDEFDEEVGKKIAYVNAQNKAYRNVSDNLIKCLWLCRSLEDVFIKGVSNMEDYKDSNTKYLIDKGYWEELEDEEEED